MTVMFVLGLVFRWLHILAAIVAVGGTVFARFVVFPSLAPLPAAQRSELHAALRGRWARIVGAAIGFLVVSGFYNFLVTVAHFQLPRWYHPLFGVKFLLALAIFGIAGLLGGKSPASDAVRRRATLWLNVNIVLAVILVCISGVLRTAERTPKPARAAAQAPRFFSGIVLQSAMCPLNWREPVTTGTKDCHHDRSSLAHAGPIARPR